MILSLFADLPASLFRPIRLAEVTDVERALRNSRLYCQDSPLTSVFHPGQRCYRELPAGDCASGHHYCFGPDGVVEESHDKASPVVGIDRNGFCVMGLRCSLKHLMADF